MRDQGAQLAAVLAFKKRIEEEKRYLFRQYDPIDQFAEMLEGHLASWLRDHESAATGPLAGDLATTEGAAGAPPPPSPEFDYWIVEANRLLKTGAPDHNAALFCATKATNAAASDIEWARATNLAGVAQFHLGKLDKSITVFTSIIERFATSIDADRREWQVKALFNKGVRLGALSRSAEEIAVYDDLLARFGTATELSLREPVAKALVRKGGHARRARPQRGGDCRLRRSAGPLRHGNRVAAARTGCAGRIAQEGFAKFLKFAAHPKPHNLLYGTTFAIVSKSLASHHGPGGRCATP
jgi:hypothetical protein